MLIATIRSSSACLAWAYKYLSLDLDRSNEEDIEAVLSRLRPAMNEEQTQTSTTTPPESFADSLWLALYDDTKLQRLRLQNSLALHCTVDTRSWTAEGTEQIRQEKATAYEKMLLRSKPELTLELFFRSHLIPTFLSIW